MEIESPTLLEIWFGVGAEPNRVEYTYYDTTLYRVLYMMYGMYSISVPYIYIHNRGLVVTSYCMNDYTAAWRYRS
jgi:hypothetical protein